MAKANGYEYPEGTLAAMQREGREEEKTYHLWHLFSTKYLIVSRSSYSFACARAVNISCYYMALSHEDWEVQNSRI